MTSVQPSPSAIHRNLGLKFGGQQEKAPESLGHIPLAYPADGMQALDTVMLKFTFSNDALIPRGIPLRPHIDQKKVQGKMFKDEGFQAIVAYGAQMATLRCGFTNNGLSLSDAHYFTKPGNSGGKTKYVVCLSFSRVEKPIELWRPVAEDIRALASTVWSECYVWDNTRTQYRSVTVNCRFPQQGNPRRVVAVRDGSICCIKQVSKMTEAEE